MYYLSNFIRDISNTVTMIEQIESESQLKINLQRYHWFIINNSHRART